MLGRDAIKLMLNEPPAAETDALSPQAKDFQVYYFYPEDVIALHTKHGRDGCP